MTAPTEIDRRHLARAIELAEGGRGRVSPNPMVGAVIGRHDEVLGEGFHEMLGGPHAEVEAIRAADGRDLERRDAVRVARALLPPGPDAAVYRSDPAGRDRTGRGCLR